MRALASLGIRTDRPGPSGRVEGGFSVVTVFCSVLFLAHNVNLTEEKKTPQSYIKRIQFFPQVLRSVTTADKGG